jgi:hypothetical protein
MLCYDLVIRYGKGNKWADNYIKVLEWSGDDSSP